MEDPVVPFDFLRMFLGEEPPLFLLEIVFRTAIIYVYTLLLLRWVGGRSIAQLSIVEFLLVIALGSAVGDALFYPDVPLFHAMLVVTLVVGADKLLDALIRRFRPVKLVVDGRAVEVIRHGVILTSGISARKLGTPELMELLRLHGIENLGQIRHGYVEASGQLSIFRFDPPRPGLSIVPPFEVAPPVPPVEGQPCCCVNCGLVQTGADDACVECGERKRARVALAREPDSCKPEEQATEPADDGRAREDQATAAGLHTADRGRPQAG